MADNPRLNEKMDAISPSESIDCYDCKYKRSGTIGYKNFYCKKYEQGVSRKPVGILFNNERCAYKEKEDGHVNRAFDNR